MKKTLNVSEQLAQFESTGRFPDSEGQADCHGFYDWFCSDSSLERRSRGLASKLRRFLKNNPELDTSRHYVFFKNNCPMRGGTYDDFRICSRETGKVVYTVVPKCSHSGMAEIWGQGADGKFQALKTAWKYTDLFTNQNQ